MSQQPNPEQLAQLKKQAEEQIASIQRYQDIEKQNIKLQKAVIERNNLHIDTIYKAYLTVSEMIQNSGGMEIFAKLDNEEIPEQIKVQLNKLGEIHTGLINDLYQFVFNGKGLQDKKPEQHTEDSEVPAQPQNELVLENAQS